MASVFSGPATAVIGAEAVNVKPPEDQMSPLVTPKTNGEVNVAGIAKRFHTVFKARLKGSLAKLLRPSSASEGVLSKVKRLSARGTDTLMISAAEDDGRDYLDFHFGPLGSHMRGNPNFKMIIVEKTDHTFSNADSQQVVIAAVQEHLEKRLLMAA